MKMAIKVNMDYDIKFTCLSTTDSQGASGGVMVSKLD